MEKNKIILIAIAVLVIALIVLGAYIITSNSDQGSVNDNVTVIKDKVNNTTHVIMIDKKGNVANDSAKNGTSIGNNTVGNATNNTNATNQTFRVYNPQSDSYVTVIGEGYDDEFDKWYTYDTDGVRYYNTRIYH